MEGIFSDHSGIKLGINNEVISGKYPEHLKTKQYTSKQFMRQRRSQNGKQEVFLTEKKLKCNVS